MIIYNFILKYKVSCTNIKLDRKKKFVNKENSHANFRKRGYNLQKS